MSRWYLFAEYKVTKCMEAKFCDFSYWEDFIVLCYLKSVLNVLFGRFASHLVLVSVHGDVS